MVHNFPAAFEAAVVPEEEVPAIIAAGLFFGLKPEQSKLAFGKDEWNPLNETDKAEITAGLSAYGYKIRPPKSS